MSRTEISDLLHRRSAAAHDRDIDRLMAVYSPGIVYFDLVPPLRYVGADALRGRFLHWFGRWESPIGQEIHDLDVLTSGDVAATHMLVRASGTLAGGRAVDYWVRVTSSCHRVDGRWLITHEHVSLPVEIATGRAAMDLVP
jgi:ketosteroid isomerase-like protein